MFILFVAYSSVSQQLPLQPPQKKICCFTATLVSKQIYFLAFVYLFSPYHISLLLPVLLLLFLYCGYTNSRCRHLMPIINSMILRLLPFWLIFSSLTFILVGNIFAFICQVQHTYIVIVATKFLQPNNQRTNERAYVRTNERWPTIWRPNERTKLQNALLLLFVVALLSIRTL